MRSRAASAACPVSLLVAALAMLPASSARAADSPPDAAVGFVVGAATLFAGFAVGGTLLASGSERTSKNAGGWLAMESGLVLAPITAHAVVGEWWRGVAFATVPAATTLGTVPVFVADSRAAEDGSLNAERVMWSLFVVGLAGAAAGVIDVAFASGRAVHVAPVLSASSAGIVAGGTL